MPARSCRCLMPRLATMSRRCRLRRPLDHDRDDAATTKADTTVTGGRRAAASVVAGGHSAGHIEPAMNFADALRRLEPTAEITALGTIRGLDTMLIPARG